MLVAGSLAGVLCASVGWLVLTQGVGLARALRREQQESEHALVTDCLANVDRVIELFDFDQPINHELPSLDHVIDLRDPRPSGAPVTAAPVIDEPPSIWHPPTTHAPRSASASA